MVISNVFCLKVPNLHLSVCLQQFSAKCHAYWMVPRGHLGSMKWNGVRKFIPFLWVEALVKCGFFRPTVYAILNTSFTFVSCTGQSLRKIEQLQFLNRVHWQRVCCRNFSTRQRLMLAHFCYHPSWGLFSATGFIFACQLDDAGGRLLSPFLSGQVTTYR